MFHFNIAKPEEAGLSSKSILSLINRLEQEEIPMHSLLLMRHNKLIAEAYYAPYHKTRLHRMFSITKTFTSLAIGILADRGQIHLSDPISIYFKDLLPDLPHPWITTMTIKDLLTMRSCHASTTYKADPDSSWVESFFTTVPTHPPGRLFHYDTSATHTLAALVERITKTDLLSFLKQNGLNKMDFSESSYIIKDPFGVSMGGTGLMATPMDLLKFGYLMQQEGYINGQQLISSEYIKNAIELQTETRITAPCSSESQGYGYQIWKNERNGYVCYGMGGQLIIFLPDYDIICVTTADTQGIQGGTQAIYHALYQELLPTASAGALTEDQGAFKALKQKIETLTIAPLTARTPASVSAYFASGSCYQLNANTIGLDTVSLTLSSDEEAGVLTWMKESKLYHLSFGMGQIKESSFPIYHLNYAASGTWLSDTTFYIKVHLIGEVVGSLHLQLAFGENDLTIFTRKNAENTLAEFQHLHLYGTIIN